jgi:hypothetical protein
MKKILACENELYANRGGHNSMYWSPSFEIYPR